MIMNTVRALAQISEVIEDRLAAVGSEAESVADQLRPLVFGQLPPALLDGIEHTRALLTR